MSPYLRAKQRCVGTGFSLLEDSNSLYLYFSVSGAPSALLSLDGTTFIVDKRFQGTLRFPFRTIISPNNDEITGDIAATLKVDGGIITLSTVNGVCTVAFEVIECINVDRRFRAKAWKSSLIPAD